MPGNSIVSADTAADVGLYSSLYLDTNGNPAVAYYDLTNADLKLVRCGNPSCSSGNTITAPDTEGSVGGWNSMVLNAAGNPAIVYRHATGGSMRLLTCGNADCTAGNVFTSPNGVGSASTGFWTSIVLDANGYPVISTSELKSLDLKVVHCEDEPCHNYVLTAPDPGTGGAYSSLRLDSAGNPVVSYRGDGGLKVLHCGNPTCTAGNGIAAPDTVGDVGQYTGLALDSLDRPVVSYYDNTNGDLKILRCGNVNCTAANTIVTPDTSGDVGQYTSLQLDASDNPVVGYYDATNGDLKVLRCGDPICAAQAIVSPDTSNDVGLYTSLALDSFGNPVVSYYDITNGDLKILHCGTPTCGSAVGGVADVPLLEDAPIVSSESPNDNWWVFAATVGAAATLLLVLRLAGSLRH